MHAIQWKIPCVLFNHSVNDRQVLYDLSLFNHLPLITIFNLTRYPNQRCHSHWLQTVGSRTFKRYHHKNNQIIILKHWLSNSNASSFDIELAIDICLTQIKLIDINISTHAIQNLANTSSTTKGTLEYEHESKTR